MRHQARGAFAAEYRKVGAPDRIRTCDLRLRRAPLYPAELRVLEARLSDDGNQRQAGQGAEWLIVPLHFAVSETVDQVIVHHPDRLHVSVDDGRADKAESPAFQILAEGVGLS
jgi:hypothetical protein